MRIQDVMSKNVISVTPATTVAAARERLRAGEIDHLVVLERKRIAGVITGRDLDRAADDAPVATVMTHPVVTIEPEATLRRAAGIMRGRAIGSLPVVDDENRLVGIVTTADLLTAMSKGEVHIAASREKIMVRNHRAPSGLRS